MRSLVAAIACASIPALLAAGSAFVFGYFDGFGLDCRTAAPGVGSGVASAIFTLFLFAPAILPCAFAGAFVGYVGIRRGIPALVRMLAFTVLCGGVLGAVVCLAIQLAGFGPSSYTADPVKYWIEAAAGGGFIGGSLGFLVSVVAGLR